MKETNTQDSTSFSLSMENIIYSCSNCDTIPKLEIKPSLEMEVTCECNEGKKWKTSIENFIDKMVLSKKNISICCGNHRSFVPAQYTCISCNEKYCLKCYISHINSNKQHKTTLEYNLDNKCSICHDEDEEVESFCKDCGIELCSTCEKEHKKEFKNHSILYIEEIKAKRNYLRFKGQSTKFAQIIETDRKSAEKIIFQLEDYLKELKEIYYKKIEEDNKILKYFDIINQSYLTYGKTEEEKKKKSYELIKNENNINPNIINNLLNQNIPELSALRRKKFFDEFLEKAKELKNSIELENTQMEKLKSLNQFNEEIINENGQNIQFLGRVEHFKTYNFTQMRRCITVLNNNELLTIDGKKLYILSPENNGEYGTELTLLHEFNDFIENIEPKKGDENLIYVTSTLHEQNDNQQMGYFFWRTMQNTMITLYNYKINEIISVIKQKDGICSFMPLQSGFALIQFNYPHQIIFYNDEFIKDSSKDSSIFLTSSSKNAFAELEDGKVVVPSERKDTKLTVFNYKTKQYECQPFECDNYIRRICVLSNKRIAAYCTTNIKIFNYKDNNLEEISTLSTNLLNKTLTHMFPLLDGGFIINYDYSKNSLIKFGADFNSTIVAYPRKNIIYDAKPMKNTNKFITIDGANKLVIWKY